MNKEVIIDIENPKDNDLISRQAVLDIVNNPLNIRLDEIIKKLPPVNPQEPMTGHWIEGKYKDTCDKCRCTYPKNIGFKNFCPNCGVRMVEPQESEGEV